MHNLCAPCAPLKAPALDEESRSPAPDTRIRLEDVGMAIMRPPLSTEDEQILRGRLRMHIDSARRGNHWAAYEAAKCMAQLGCFDGPHARSRRMIFAKWMDGVHPDVAAQGWAEFIASRGGR